LCSSFPMLVPWWLVRDPIAVQNRVEGKNGLVYLLSLYSYTNWSIEKYWFVTDSFENWFENQSFSISTNIIHKELRCLEDFCKKGWGFKKGWLMISFKPILKFISYNCNCILIISVLFLSIYPYPPPPHPPIKLHMGGVKSSNTYCRKIDFKKSQVDASVCLNGCLIVYMISLKKESVLKSIFLRKVALWIQNLSTRSHVVTPDIKKMLMESDIRAPSAMVYHARDRDDWEKNHAIYMTGWPLAKPQYHALTTNSYPSLFLPDVKW
jgi:hypothetical protein